MNELLQAAKAVIDRWDNYSTIMDSRVIHDLRAAVERAVKPPAYFDEWMANNSTSEMRSADRVDLFGIWYAAQHAERERIRGEIETLKSNCSDDGEWRECCNEILEMIDAE